MRVALAFALLLAGCHPAGNATVTVAIQPTAPIANALGFHLTVLNQGQTATADYQLPGQTELAPSNPVTLSLIFSKDHSGPVSVTAEARGLAGQLLASGVGTGTVVPGEVSVMVVAIGPSNGADGGTGGDLPGADLLTPDLLAPDLLVGVPPADLASGGLPDLLAPDLLAPPDLALPDGNID